MVRYQYITSILPTSILSFRNMSMVSRCVFRCAPLTFVTSAAQCRFWQCVGCCVLLRGVSFWSLGNVLLLCSEWPFGCGSISMEWSTVWAAVPSDGPPYQSLRLSEVLLLCPGLGWERSSLLKRRYISLKNEWMNEWKEKLRKSHIRASTRCFRSHAWKWKIWWTPSTLPPLQ